MGKFVDEESEESSDEESVEVPVARRKFADEEDSDDVRDKEAVKCETGH
jgi:hypothetical protein